MTDAVGERLLESIPDAPDVAAEQPMVLTAPDSEPAQAYRRLASNLAVHVETADRNTPLYSPTATATGN